MLNGADEVSTHTECVINNQGNSVVVCDLIGQDRHKIKCKTYLGQSRDVAEVGLGVTDTFDVDCLCFVIDRRCESFWSFLCNELEANSVVFEGYYWRFISTDQTTQFLALMYL